MTFFLRNAGVRRLELRALSPSPRADSVARQKGRSHLLAGGGEKNQPRSSHKTSAQWRFLLRAAEIANALRTPWEVRMRKPGHWLPASIS